MIRALANVALCALEIACIGIYVAGVIDAATPEEAARLARDKQQYPRDGYWCGVFQVTPHDSAETETIDLDEIDEQNATAATHGA